MIDTVLWTMIVVPLGLCHANIFRIRKRPLDQGHQLLQRPSRLLNKRVHGILSAVVMFGLDRSIARTTIFRCSANLLWLIHLPRLGRIRWASNHISPDNAQR